MYLVYFLCGPYYFLYVRLLLPVSTQFIPCALFIDSVLNKVDTQYLPSAYLTSSYMTRSQGILLPYLHTVKFNTGGRNGLATRL